MSSSSRPPTTRVRVVRKPSRRRFFSWRGLGLTLLGLVLLVIGLGGIAYAMIDIPSPNDLARAESSIIYYADGRTELERLSEVNRESVPLSQVPQHTRQAMLAAEDRDFYDNNGVSISGIARSAWRTFRGEDNAGGGSTITQQYVKNYFLTQDQSIVRKGREIVIAVKIDQQQSKDQILENYLNTIYYGRNAYGIKTAAQAYFDKDVSQLTVGESALLATVVNQPSRLDPGLGEDATRRATDRWNYVLAGMVSKGWLTQAQRDATPFPQVATYTPRQVKSGPDGYLKDVVKRELIERGIATEDDIATKGLRVTMTVDQDTQASLAQAVDNNRPSYGRGADVRVGAVAIKPGDGAIVALYGGRDFATQPFNDATQGHMQAGSTMKAFAVVAALKQGISTRTNFDSSTPYTAPGASKPVNNWDFRGHGWVDMPEMLADSINTAFTRLNVRIGPENTKKTAIDLGISPPPEDGGEPPADSPGLDSYAGNVLGSAAVRPIDLANAYATIAAEGQRARPYIVRSVTSADGALTYNGGPELTTVIDRAVAVDTTAALRSVVQSGTGTGASAVGRPAAGKTGTSEESKSAWFVAYTPQLSTAVGMFVPDKDGNATSMNGLWGLQSGALPVQVWTQFTRAALAGEPVEWFPQRVGIGDDRAYVPPPPPTYTPRPRPTQTTESSESTQTSVPTSTETETAMQDESSDEEQLAPSATRGTSRPPGAAPPTPGRPATVRPAPADGFTRGGEDGNSQ